MQFYATPPHICSYLPRQQAINVFADPFAPMSMELYGKLIDLGFRRSGRNVYRPHCSGCRACVATRIPVKSFTPDRSQRRNLVSNSDLIVRVQGPEYREEHFKLYHRYVNMRHAGGEMENPSADSYRTFLHTSWADTRFVEFRDRERLLCVSVVDQLSHGLSAVYTFYDPEQSKRGLGVYAVLWQINEALRSGMPFVYLGYWISGHPKMGYKVRFRPLEGLKDGRWQLLT